MPEVSQFYRQQRLTPLSGVGQLSSADIQAATQGNRELAKGLDALTDQGIQFIEQKEKAEFHNQLNTSKTEYLTKFFNYEQDLTTNADTETYLPNLKSGQTSSFNFTNKRAANEFELWKANEDLSQTRRVFGAKNDQDVQNYTQNWNLGIKEATRRTASAVSETDYQLELANGRDYFGLELVTEDKDGVPVPVLDKKGNPTLQLKEDWENPLLDTDEVRMAGYESWKADADAKRAGIIRGKVTETGFNAWQATVDIEDPDGKLQDGLDVINASGMAEPDKQKARAALETRVRNSRAETKLETQQATAKSTEEVFKKIGSGEYEGINAFIKTLPNLTEKQQVALQEKAALSIKAINANKPDPMQETNSQVYFETARNIDNMTEPKLAVLVGKGLSIADYEKFKGQLEKDSPLNKPSSKRAQDAVSRIRGIDVKLAIKGAKEGEQVLAATAREADYLRIQNDLDDWIEKNIGDENFDAKLKLKTEQLLSPIIEDVSLNWLETILSPKDRKGLDFGLRTESQELAQERIQSIKKDTVFKDLSADDRDEVVKLIEDGFSGQEAVDRVKFKSLRTIDQTSTGESIFDDDLPTPKTKADYDAIPSGSDFIDTDGTRKRKQ